jgi:hypothetical protein
LLFICSNYFSCKNEDTERVLQETVQETTNKMNRVLKQETTNEVIRIEMEGKIREEELKKRVLVCYFIVLVSVSVSVSVG